MIKLTNVKKYFNKRKGNEIRAIDNTTVELADSGLVTFLGNSGCGKTTLLNAIGGLDKVDSGEIRLDNQRITGRTSGKRDEIRNVNIGYIFQNYNLIEDATVFDNVAIALKMIGFKDKVAIEKRVMFVLERVGIARYRNRPAKMLSGGERQRVGIARALVKNPRIIIADEPTGNLDSANTIEVMNIIKAISKEKLVILVTHERNIAEFYADRVIEIVDGKIVSDKENDHEGSLDYRLDTKIYLKDMPYVADLSSSGFDVKLYSDTSKLPPPIKIAIRNNNLYIDFGDSLNMGAEGIELVDGHYKELSKEIYEDYEFNYADFFKSGDKAAGATENGGKTAGATENGDKAVGATENGGKTAGAVENGDKAVGATENGGKTEGPAGKVGNTEGPLEKGVPRKIKYRPIYGVFNSLVAGFKKIHGYSKIKKLLLLGFAIASMFVIYAASNVAGVTNIVDSRFTTTHQNYLAVNTGRVTETIYNQYANMEGVDFVVPGDGRVAFVLPIDKYLQSQGMGISLHGAVAKNHMLDESLMLYGRTIQNPNEIVLDYMVYKNTFEGFDTSAKEVGYTEPERVLGAEVRLSPWLPPFVIVGVYGGESPCIYVEDSMLETVVTESIPENAMVANMSPVYVAGDGEIVAYSRAASRATVSDEPDIKITHGEAPTADYQALVPESYRENRYIGDTIEATVNGRKLEICGFYKDARQGGGIYVNDRTKFLSVITSKESLTINPLNKTELYGVLSQGESRVIDNYAEDLQSYKAGVRMNIFRTVLVAGVIVIISLIEIYLIMRASFLSRIKEVGVLRAIGLKKGDLYRMFAGEAVAITLLTTLPAMALMAYIIKALTTVSYVAASYKMNIWIFLASFALVFCFNLLAGLLPVFGTLRKTPAAILARNDVN